MPFWLRWLCVWCRLHLPFRSRRGWYRGWYRRVVQSWRARGSGGVCCRGFRRAGGFGRGLGCRRWRRRVGGGCAGCRGLGCGTLFSLSRGLAARSGRRAGGWSHDGQDDPRGHHYGRQGQLQSRFALVRHHHNGHPHYCVIIALPVPLLDVARIMGAPGALVKGREGRQRFR